MLPALPKKCAYLKKHRVSRLLEFQYSRRSAHANGANLQFSHYMKFRHFLDVNKIS